MAHEPTSTFDELFDGDEVREVLSASFYKSEPQRRKRKKTKKADHYDVICISLYKEDLARLDEKVAYLKAQGHRKMSRSALIRFALDTVDLDALPRSY
ncbi:MAG: hypothetical protein AAF411_16960 [Myxococcota bacterium]